MSYIDSLNQAATASAQANTSKADKGNDIMGKEDFLTLLVAQLKNQDPLNPDDPTEFTAQLAQFSSLEQLFNLNESMDNVAASVSDSQKLSALSMIGKEVTYASGTFNFEGEPVQIGYSLDGDASDITLSIQQDGKTYATLKGVDLTEGNHFMTWDGTATDGTIAPTGEYTIVIEASAASGSIAAAPLIRSEVTGVDLDGDKGGLLYTRAGEVNLNEIKGVFDISTGSNQEEQAGQDEALPEEETVTEMITDIAEETVPTEG